MAQVFHHKCPGKIFLLGEWAVLEASPALVHTLDEYFELKVFEKNQKSALSLHTGELHFEVSPALSLTENIQQAPEVFKKSLEMMSSYCAHFGKEISELRSFEFHFQRKWPLYKGWGSSSALMLSLHRFFEKRYQQEMNTFEFYKKFYPHSSGADLVSQINGGMCLVEKNQGQDYEFQLPENAFLIHTREKFSSEKKVKEQRASPALLELKDSMLRYLKNKNFIEAVNEHQKIFEKMEIVPKNVIEMKRKWMKENLIEAFKCTGAGGGDSILVLPKTAAAKEQCLQDLPLKNWDYSLIKKGEAAGEIND